MKAVFRAEQDSRTASRPDSSTPAKCTRDHRFVPSKQLRISPTTERAAAAWSSGPGTLTNSGPKPNGFPRPLGSPGLIDPHRPQPQRVAQADRGQRHRRRGDHGRLEDAECWIGHACCDRHARRVTGEGEEQVLRMLPMTARDSFFGRTIPTRSPLRRVTPAVSMATTVPVPMAMPTLARGVRRGIVYAAPAMAAFYRSSDFSRPAVSFAGPGLRSVTLSVFCTHSFELCAVQPI